MRPFETLDSKEVRLLNTEYIMVIIDSTNVKGCLCRMWNGSFGFYR
jgi:hypothetical protein